MIAKTVPTSDPGCEERLGRSNFALRPLGEIDRERILAWRNDPFIIERSSSRRAVTREEHDAWFDGILHSSESLGFIVEWNGNAIGQVRFDRDAPGRCIITAYLLQPHTGKGLGVEAIRRACSIVRQQWPNHRIVAFVRADNPSGQSAFRKAGFVDSATPSLAGHVTMTLDSRPPVAHEEERMADLYRSLLTTHGESYRTLNWGSREGQWLRFAVLAGIGDLAGARILDVGCGLAHFADWLEEQGIAVDYTGLDLTPELLDEAARRRPGLRFVQGSILDASLLADEHFDYVFASGIFTYYRESAEATLQKAVARMWSLAGRGLAFNSLSAWASDPCMDEYYPDPLAVAGYGRTITPWVVLRHDYHPRDFTVYLTREPRRP